MEELDVDGTTTKSVNAVTKFNLTLRSNDGVLLTSTLSYVRRIPFSTKTSALQRGDY